MYPIGLILAYFLFALLLNQGSSATSKEVVGGQPPTYFFQKLDFIATEITLIWMAELHGCWWGIVDAYPDCSFIACSLLALNDRVYGPRETNHAGGQKHCGS